LLNRIKNWLLISKQKVRYPSEGGGRKRGMAQTVSKQGRPTFKQPEQKPGKTST